jgi:hypothetical protein
VVQLMPPAPVTVPMPVRSMLRSYLTKLNVAVTVVAAAVVVTPQEPLPVQGPDQTNVDSGWGVACNVTRVPAGIAAEQVAPQLMLPPDQFAVTVPEPLPCRAIIKLAFLMAKVTLTWIGL